MLDAVPQARRVARPDCGGPHGRNLQEGLSIGAGRTAADDAANQPELAFGAADASASCAAVEALQEQHPPTRAMKEVLRLRKKLRQIMKIEGRVAEGLQIDTLQQLKLQKKAGVASQLAEAESRVAEEDTFAWKATSWQKGVWPVLASLAEVNENMTPLHFGADQIFQVWVYFTEELAEPWWQQHPQPHQQSSSLGPAHAVCAQDGQPDGDGMHASAQRRLRRKRHMPYRPKLPGDGAHDCKPDCAKIMEGLEAGGEARSSALAQLKGSVARLAFESAGCRAVQLAIHVAEREVVTQLLEELHGLVHRALRSPHANYVLQALVAALPAPMSGFVARELLGGGAEAARHRFGCRVLCRLVEHSVPNWDLADLLQEVLAEAEDLCRHPYAHFVMQSILEHVPEHRLRIAQVLRADLPNGACHRCASHVLETALKHCAEEDRQALAFELGSCRERVVAMAQNQYGHFVLQALLRLPGSTAEAARGYLQQARTRVEGTKYGKRLLMDLGWLSAAGVRERTAPQRDRGLECQ